MAAITSGLFLCAGPAAKTSCNYSIINWMIKTDTLLSQQEIAILRKQKSWLSILIIFSMWSQVAFAFYLFITYPSAVTWIISSIIVGSKQFQMAVLMHDGAHGLIFKNRRLNDIASQWFCAYPIMSDTLPYRKYHSAHHKYTETDKDPDRSLSKAFPTSKLSLARKIFRDISGIAGVRRYIATINSAWGKDQSFAQHLKNLFLKLKGFLMTNAIIFGILYSLGYGWLYLGLWWIPLLTVFSLFYRIRSITEHAGVVGGNDLMNTRTTIVPWYLKYFLAPLNVNYHIEHHLFTFCPWYNLPKAHQMLREKEYLPKMEIANGYREIYKKILLPLEN